MALRMKSKDVQALPGPLLPPSRPPSCLPDSSHSALPPAAGTHKPLSQLRASALAAPWSATLSFPADLLMANSSRKSQLQRPWREELCRELSLFPLLLGPSFLLVIPFIVIGPL